MQTWQVDKINNLFLQCRSRNPSERFPEEEGDSTVEVDIQPPYPFNQSLLSSEESEEGEQVEDTDLPAASWHPKPLGVSADHTEAASAIRPSSDMFKNSFVWGK